MECKQKLNSTLQPNKKICQPRRSETVTVAAVWPNTQDLQHVNSKPSKEKKNKLSQTSKRLPKVILLRDGEEEDEIYHDKIVHDSERLDGSNHAVATEESKCSKVFTDNHKARSQYN